jgi:disulfide bond formation protein DsbB
MNQKTLFTLLAWLCALIASLGSLFFSEVMEFVPCVLCWYQRICMYPLVLILGLSLYKQENSATLYALPLALIGFAIALYHNLLHYEIVPESASPCIQGVPCSTVYINWLGFITIPILSMSAFVIIIALLWKTRHEKY